MATFNTPSSSLLSLLHRSFPQTVPSNASDTDDIDVACLSPRLYPNISYTPEENAEIKTWVSTSERLGKLTSNAEGISTFQASERFHGLDSHLHGRPTILGTKPSVADVALYARLAPALEGWSAEERSGKAGFVNILRYLESVQNSAVFSLKIPEDEKLQLEVPENQSQPATHKPLVVGLTKDKSTDSSPQGPSQTDKAKNNTEGGNAAGVSEKGSEKKQVSFSGTVAGL